jgi:hypothetical protein
MLLYYVMLITCVCVCVRARARVCLLAAQEQTPLLSRLLLCTKYDSGIEKLVCELVLQPAATMDLTGLLLKADARGHTCINAMFTAQCVDVLAFLIERGYLKLMLGSDDKCEVV